MKVMKAMQLSGRSPLSAVAFFAVLASVIAGPLAAVNQQLPIPNDFQQPQLRRAKVAERKLTGKFLHITGMPLPPQKQLVADRFTSC